MSKKARQKEIENREQLDVLLSNYKNMAVKVFEWKNLPESIPAFYPENWLFQNGMAVMIKLADEEYAILPVAYGSVKLNIYGLPTQWRAYAVGASPQAMQIKSMVLDDTNSVLIWNDTERRATYPFIEYLCRKMLITDNTTITNIKAQKTPYVIKANQSNLLTAKNIVKEIDEGYDYVFKDEFDSVGVDILPTEAPFVADKLMDCYLEYHNRILSFLGIDNLPVEKQERMITGETEANDEYLYLIRENRLSMRKDACKKMNELWGLNVEVEYNDKFEGLPDMPGAREASKTSGTVGNQS